MIELKSAIQIVNGIHVDTWSLEVASFNILEVEAGTTGAKGGDTGHSGRTYLRLSDLGSTDLSVRVNKQGDFEYCEDIEIAFGGDSELHTFMEALNFALATLSERE